MGGEPIWRTVDEVDRLLRGDRTGVGDRLTKYFAGFDLAGKTVVDLGCNIGFYSYFAAIKGARRVVGLEESPELVALGRRIGHDYQIADLELRVADFLAGPPQEKFDLALMIDVIGNNRVAKGRVGKMLDALAGFGAAESIVTLRPVFDIRAHLGTKPDRLTDRYPAQRIRRGKLYLLEHIEETYADVWAVSLLSGEDKRRSQAKEMLLLTRKGR